MTRRVRLLGRCSPRRAVAISLTLVAYLLLTAGVIWSSPVLTLDNAMLHWNIRAHHPQYFQFLHGYVMLGQRAPATLAALPWFVWRAWKSRSARPLLVLGAALLVLNVSVGAVKLATGRWGPLITTNVHDIFNGGDIYPSGHTSNTVVLYGVIAMVAVSHRRALAAAAVFLSLSIGLSTIYLDTHWFSDVVGGWLAGGLVLLVLPILQPAVDAAYDATRRRLARWNATRTAARALPPAVRPEPARVPQPAGELARTGPAAGGAGAHRHAAARADG